MVFFLDSVDIVGGKKYGENLNEELFWYYVIIWSSVRDNSPQFRVLKRHVGLIPQLDNVSKAGHFEQTIYPSP
jgi:hypothetical protein